MDDSGVRVAKVGFVSAEMIWAEVDVADDAKLGPRRVTVVNPDGGRGTSADAVLDVIIPPGDKPIGLGVRRYTVLGPRPLEPLITLVEPRVAGAGTAITIEGERFLPLPEENSVTFPGPGNIRLPAVVKEASPGRLVVIVPDGAVDGLLTVAVNGMVAAAVTRQTALVSITTPILSAIIPREITPGLAPIQLDVVGQRFAKGAHVAIVPPDGVAIESVEFVSPARLRLRVMLAQDAPNQPRSATVTNPPEAGGELSTLPDALTVVGAPALSISVPNLVTYLPSVHSVILTTHKDGTCNTKDVTPDSVDVLVTFRPAVGVNTIPPTAVTISLDPAFTTALPGTATNEDCELGPSPTRDFSIGLPSAAPDVTSQQVTVGASTDSSGDTVYRAKLHSWDWGGRVRIDATGKTATGTVTGSLELPLDSDGDGLPDVYENNAKLNANPTGDNVLDSKHPDLNGNQVKDGDDKFAPDGLSNFDKYRGVYLVGPAPGVADDSTHTYTLMSGHTRLGSGMRHLFVRGMGFASDPYIGRDVVSSTSVQRCGVRLTPYPPPPADDSGLCPSFAVGTAFEKIGVEIHDVTDSFRGVGSITQSGGGSSFTYAAGSQLPEFSLMKPQTQILKRVTVILAAQCQSGTDCSTYWRSRRHWEFADLGFEGGAPILYKPAIDAYFTDKPYAHRTNDGAAVILAPDGSTPMLAPIWLVADHNDDGQPGTNEPVDRRGDLLGDTRIPDPPYNHDLSGVDVNHDGCVELPLVSDPSVVGRCVATTATASSPQATYQQVTRWVVTHELGHAVGRLDHSSDPTDIMYQGRSTWTSDNHFSQDSESFIAIDNRWPR
jgi:hypothetical protein